MLLGRCDQTWKLFLLVQVFCSCSAKRCVNAFNASGRAIFYCHIDLANCTRGFKRSRKWRFPCVDRGAHVYMQLLLYIGVLPDDLEPILSVLPPTEVM